MGLLDRFVALFEQKSKIDDSNIVSFNGLKSSHQKYSIKLKTII